VLTRSMLAEGDRTRFLAGRERQAGTDDGARTTGADALTVEAKAALIWWTWNGDYCTG
jgi:hypothetical protein